MAKAQKNPSPDSVIMNIINRNMLTPNICMLIINNTATLAVKSQGIKEPMSIKVTTKIAVMVKLSKKYSALQ